MINVYPQKSRVQICPMGAFMIMSKDTTGINSIYPDWVLPRKNGISSAPLMNIRAGGMRLPVIVILFFHHDQSQQFG